MKRFISAFLTFSMVMIMMGNTVFASSADKIQNSILPKILNAVAYAGYAIALGMLLYLGAKYTLSAANEKADVKQGAIAYLIGVVLIVGASVFANTVSAIAAGGNAGSASSMAGTIIQKATDAAK